MSKVPSCPPDAHDVGCPLHTARQAQLEASCLGFDWTAIEGVLAKAQEEIDELREALACGDHAQAQAELGDLLFTAVNLSRFLDIEPGLALDKTTARFRRRYQAVTQAVQDAGKDPRACSLDELDLVWEAIKRDELSERHDP